MLRDPQADLARFGDVIYQDRGLEPVSFEEIAARATRSRAAHNAQVLLDALRQRDVPNPTLGGAVAVLKDGVRQRCSVLRAVMPTTPAPRAAPSRACWATPSHTLSWRTARRRTHSTRVDRRASSTERVSRSTRGTRPTMRSRATMTSGSPRRLAERPWRASRSRLHPWTAAVDKPPAEPTRWLGMLAPIKQKGGIFGREDVLGVADSGLLVCRTRYADRLAASFAMYTFRDTGPIYVKRFLGFRPADLLAESRARHVPWDVIASIVAGNGGTPARWTSSSTTVRPGG